MKISNIKYDIVTEENDYAAESRAQKMLEMASELRAQRDKAQQVYEPATQEIGWKKVQVFLDNIERQIRPLLYALREIKEASNDLHGRFCIRVFMPEQPITLWELYGDSDGKIEIQARPFNGEYPRLFPGGWVNEKGEPRSIHSEEVFYGKNGLIANTDFSLVLQAIDKTIESEFNMQLNKMRDEQTYYENSFKKMANTDKNVSLDALIRSAEKRAKENFEKGSSIERDFEME